ncbi:MAG: hypothetical protein ACM3O9_07245 [Methylocystaceae bacterium]
MNEKCYQHGGDKLRPNTNYSVILMGFCLLLVVFGCNNPTKPPRSQTEQAPAFSLPVYGSEQQVELKDLSGQPVVINFWSTT